MLQPLLASVWWGAGNDVANELRRSCPYASCQFRSIIVHLHLPHVSTGWWVHSCRRLVHDDDFSLSDQGDSDRQFALHTTRIRSTWPISRFRRYPNTDDRTFNRFINQTRRNAACLKEMSWLCSIEIWNWLMRANKLKCLRPVIARNRFESNCWTYDTFWLARTGSGTTLTLLIEIVPDDGAYSPRMHLIAEVFPAPLTPTRSYYLKTLLFEPHPETPEPFQMAHPYQRNARPHSDQRFYSSHLI